MLHHTATHSRLGSFLHFLMVRSSASLLLLTGILCLVFLLFNIHPLVVKDVLWANSYLPLFGCWFTTHLGFWWLLTGNFRRSILLAIFMTLLLVWKVADMLHWISILITVIPILLIEVLLYSWKK